jgi:pimeloyl-ACP methyl ester carboxylesterase
MNHRGVVVLARGAFLLVSGALSCGAALAAPGAEGCAALAAAGSFSFPDDAFSGNGDRGNKGLTKEVPVTITAATLRPPAGTVPEYCRVTGTIQTGDEKQGFGNVRFQVNLPTVWNGRFVMMGDGGHDGSVSSSTARVDQGYVTANSDSGHVGGNASFAFNNRVAEIDYGWRAPHVTTVTTKGLIEAYYGKKPEYSYWEGCSTGGRQAAVAAQRFPGDYDGIVSGDPFNHAIETAMEQMWSSKVFFQDVNGDGVGFDNNITQADIDALRDSVLAKCDVLGNDRIKDNVVDDPIACRRVFGDADIEALGVARNLSAGQVQAIKDVYRGPHDSSGRRWNRGKPLGSEFSWGSIVVPTPANGNFPGQGGFSFSLVNFLFFEHDPGVPTARPNDPSLLPGPGEYRWLDFNYDSNTPTGRTIEQGTNAAWNPRDGGGFMREILNGTETNLDFLKKKTKGKYLLYHGFADGLIGPEPTIDYYDGIVKDTFAGERGKAEQNVRLFLVPGMGHCSGGVRGAAVNWDKLAPLVQWVEQGVAPKSIVVTSAPAGNERILCPWPQQPTYIGPTGSGAENNPANWKAANFACQASVFAE